MTKLIRAASLAVLIARAPGAAPAQLASAADAHRPVIQVAASDATSRFVPLGIGKSVAIDLPADIKDVLVADPKIANAVIRSSRRAYMIGVAVGQTNIFFFDAERQADRRLRHRGDARSQRRARRAQAHVPDADIHIEGVGDGVMLYGHRVEPGRIAAGLRSRRRGWSATAPRWSTASRCAAATRSCSR